jgi:hypothetical protein
MSGKVNPERDVRVKLPLDPEAALKALLAVNPDDEPADDDSEEQEQQERKGGRG